MSREQIILNLKKLVPTSGEKISHTFADPLPRDDFTFDILTNLLTSSPDHYDNEELDEATKLSFRAMTYLMKDIDDLTKKKQLLGGQESDSLYNKSILNPVRAGLLSKHIFSAYRYLEKLNQDPTNGNKHPGKLCIPYLPHLNKTLSSLLSAFPTQVVGASCVGGKDGIEMSLMPMMQLHKHGHQSKQLLSSQFHPTDESEDSLSSILKSTPNSSSPLVTMSEIITVGCTGRKKNDMTLLQQQQAYMSGASTGLDEVLISKGHRRKFVHSFSQWGGFNHFINLILMDSVPLEDVVDVLLSCIESITFPHQTVPSPMTTQSSNIIKQNKDEESVGEEALFNFLANQTLLEKLFDSAKKRDTSVDADSSCISNVIVGLFEIATGKIRKQASLPIANASEDNDSVECKISDNAKTIPAPGIDDNKLIKTGITDRMHTAFNANMSGLLDVMDIYMTRELGRTIKHPGRYIVQKSFTANRLQYFTLFTDLVSYESHFDLKDRGNRKSAISTMDVIMAFPCPLEGNGMEEGAIYNPWPGICDALFAYPENNMLQYQFYRLIHSICITNHEATLKLLVQKCKFLSRAIKACQDASSSTRGILLRCLNALRLCSQSLSSHSFLRHYIDSHDGWKSFKVELEKVTMEQQQRGGGIAIPSGIGSEATSFHIEEISINLGSPYATEMGFGGVEIHDDTKDEVEEDADESDANGSPTKKKKKKKTKKKK